MKKKLFFLSLVFMFCLSGLILLDCETVWSVDAKILDLAKKEKKVVWYTTMPGKGIKAVEKAFEKKYPLDLEVFKAGSLDIIGRYNQEVSASRPTADCIHITDMVFFLDMMEKDKLIKYDSPEFKAYTDLPKGWIYPGYIVPLRVMPIAALVNTKVVDWKSIKSYEDMLNTKYKKLISAGDVASSTRAYINYYGLRTTYGTGWYEKLRELDSQYYESSEKAFTNCVSGEWPILFEAWLYTDYQGRVLKKAPVHSVYPKEGCVVMPAPNTIMKEAPHPNAAKVFQDFLYSKDTQILLGKNIGVHSGRNDVPGPPEMPKLSEIKIINIDFKAAKAKRKEMIAEWRKISGR